MKRLVEVDMILAGWVVFNSNWVMAGDVLRKEGGGDYRVLDFKTTERDVVIHPIIPVELGVRTTYRQSFSCVRLDGRVRTGDRFYVV